MAEVIADRVKQTSTSSGLGDFVLSGIVPGFKQFSQVMGVGDSFHGCIVAVDANGAPTGEWEIGYYTYVSTNTIRRDTVRSSSATSNAKVPFSGGTKHVFLDLTAYQIRNFSTSTSSGTAATPTGQPASGYTSMTFQEEFAGTTIDSAKWKNFIYYKTDNATQNFSVDNGNLNIWPQTDSTGAFFDRTFVTENKFTQTYGFFEAEIQLPVGAGLRPVFSLFNNDEHEIEICHAYSGAPGGGWASADLHPIDWEFNRLTSQADTQGNIFRAKNYINVPDLSQQFHRYGVRWDSSTVRWYFDGSQVGPTVNHTTMNVPMYIYIGLWKATNETSATAGSGVLSSTNRYTPQGINNAMKINYVRAWQIAT